MSHARLGPSNHRWPHCPGSIREESAYPDSSGDAAIDGTGSHLLLELCIAAGNKSGKYDASEWLDRTIGEGHEDRPQGWWVKQDRIDRVQMMLDYIQRRRKEMFVSYPVASEVQSNPGYYFGRDDWWGTVDVEMRTKEILEVSDYKDGRMYVDVKDNSQLISYAAGRLAPFILQDGGVCDPTKTDIKTVRMSIVQPKTNPAVRYVDMTPVDLWNKAVELSIAAAMTDDPDAMMIEGKHCTWCKHGRAGNCEAKARKVSEGVKRMNLDMPDVPASEMTDQQLAEIMDAAPLITKMIEQVNAETKSRIESGGTVPGYIMGTGRSSKKWADDEEIVAKKLTGMRQFKKADAYPAKLITPAAALKFPGLSDRQKASIEKMIEVVPGKPSVVRSNKTVNTVEDMFGANDTGMSFM